MLCIFGGNTLKIYTQKHHKYITYLIVYDFIKIYSFVTNNSFFIMSKKCFSIPPRSFPQYILNIKIHIEYLVVEVDLQLCGVKFLVKLVSGNVSLIHLRRVSVEAV